MKKWMSPPSVPFLRRPGAVTVRGNVVGNAVVMVTFMGKENRKKGKSRFVANRLFSFVVIAAPVALLSS